MPTKILTSGIYSWWKPYPYPTRYCAYRADRQTFVLNYRQTKNIFTDCLSQKVGLICLLDTLKWENRMITRKKLMASLAQAGITLRRPGESFGPSDVRVFDESALRQIALWGSSGLANTYINGKWDCERPDIVVAKAIQYGLDSKISSSLSDIALKVRSAFFNLQSKARSLVVGKTHYDAGNTLYEVMLGKYMVYSCGLWSGTVRAQTLDEAQEAKLDLICRKLKLKRGDHILDIGCGFGELLRFAHQRYGVTGVGITISEQQASYARKLCHGLPIEIWVIDYRDLATYQKFNHVVSVGMFEHVGPKNYSKFFRKVLSLLERDGLFLLHSIIGSGEPDPFLNDTIFPGSVPPTEDQVAKSSLESFQLHDFHEFGRDYDPTCCAWEKNLSAGWLRFSNFTGEELRKYRRWKLYLLVSAGLFRPGKTKLGQWMFSNRESGIIYQPVR